MKFGAEEIKNLEKVTLNLEAKKGAQFSLMKYAQSKIVNQNASKFSTSPSQLNLGSGRRLSQKKTNSD